MLLAETTTSTPSPTVTHATTLSASDGLAVLWAVGIIVIAAGVVVIVGRLLTAPKQAAQAGDSGPSIMRPWIAISLVAGLLVFCALTFVIDDDKLRSTLFGGLVANVGAAVAFYFSSKNADQARQDILGAALGTTDVPDLVGTPPESKTVADARATMSQTPLALVVNPPEAGTTDKVTKQSPAKGTNVRNGSKVTVETELPKVDPGQPKVDPGQPKVDAGQPKVDPGQPIA
jgi:Ca2+/Na+ antiporter